MHLCITSENFFVFLYVQVIDCLERVLKSDTDPGTRRAAISVAKHLFKGLDTSMDKVKADMQTQIEAVLLLFRFLKEVLCRVCIAC